TGISRDDFTNLHVRGAALGLHERDTLLDRPAKDFVGLLTPLQLARLKEAILDDTSSSLRRRQIGHLDRAERASLPARIVTELYTAKGGGLEQAVTDALQSIGLQATRVRHQPHAEADIYLQFGGTIAISVTAADDDRHPIA